MLKQHGGHRDCRCLKAQQRCEISSASRPVFSYSLTENSNADFTCPSCGKLFTDFSSAVKLHQECLSWSCRFLHDIYSAFHTQLTSSGYFKSICRLCGEGYTRFIGQCVPPSMWEHAKSHALGYCNQDIFLTEQAFVNHLCSSHSARASDMGLWGYNTGRLEAWECLQMLSWRDGRALLRTVQKFEPKLGSQTSISKP